MSCVVLGTRGYNEKYCIRLGEGGATETVKSRAISGQNTLSGRGAAGQCGRSWCGCLDKYGLPRLTVKTHPYQHGGDDLYRLTVV